LKIVLKAAAGTHPAVTWNYGNFLQVTFDFLIVAFSVFMVIKAINTAKKKEKVTLIESPSPSKEEPLLTEIRDLFEKTDQPDGDS
jgi:large conductance mechanosensitive channel